MLLVVLGDNDALGGATGFRGLATDEAGLNIERFARNVQERLRGDEENYAVVTIVPIGLVVAWLYAIMEIAGFALNFVSATIGAVSIGVGIDYSIHMTERFREEVGRSATRIEALRRAASGTGVSLLASAGSSVVGFAIMGFAPMPMFSTYGILTALMIFLALAASLVVLPALLMLVTPEQGRVPSTGSG